MAATAVQKKNQTDHTKVPVLTGSFEAATVDAPNPKCIRRPGH